MLLYEAPAAAGTLSEKTDKAAFWFAAEEHVMRDLAPGEPVLMLWRTRDTAMVGAHQIAEAEVDRAYAEAAGIDIVRRASGGGAIFTDAGTLLYTIILPHREGMDPKDVVRERLAGPVTRALSKLGVTAALEGRNDLLIGGRKFSGIAQCLSGGYLLSHGSLLFDADLAKLARVLTVGREKIETKAVPSVRARVTNITEHTQERDIAAFRQALVESWAEDGPLGRRVFGEGSLSAIGAIMRGKYENPSWTYGHAPAFSIRNKARFPGGGVEAFLSVEGGKVASVRITGDFLALRPASEVEGALLGAPYEKEALASALARARAAEALGSITEEELLSVLLV
ncbi:MAG: lipoate--protein ligase [Clostridiales Family XIII bacterium]|jgi:lipoate-protein ligase A|nr:lipoate--protein ligase [Clostridiales Family XIII bacterium]